MNRVFSGLLFSSFVLCAAALPACTAAVIDEEACSTGCPDPEEAPDAPGAEPDPVRMQAMGIVVPQSPAQATGIVVPQSPAQATGIVVPQSPAQATGIVVPQSPASASSTKRAADGGAK